MILRINVNVADHFVRFVSEGLDSGGVSFVCSQKRCISFGN